MSHVTEVQIVHVILTSNSIEAVAMTWTSRRVLRLILVFLCVNILNPSFVDAIDSHMMEGDDVIVVAVDLVKL